ncbi:hypothetical protein Dsin_018003 [Dipteronia sinensis]|uniref:Uncharacterized protein n=1 Tax=Dipteronia sinensis TaxID=43782 RepID=A0AAE0AHC2_9ROSI|nr:hypothetical protein Dsin_018003 [Dipteronia sinensis]
MAELLGVSQSSLVLLRSKLGLPSRHSALQSRNTINYKSLSISPKRITTSVAVVSSDSKSSTIIANSDSGKDEIKIDFGGGGGGGGGENFGGGGGGGGDDKNYGGEESSEESGNKKKGMSMSQKLTLGYAALVGVGGLMGYLKSGSQKSLLAGGLSASLLFFVYTQLPTKPVLASFIGFGLSAALLGVMGSRFKKSGKIFPAGVVSLVSLVMTGGYLHGIMRSHH